MGEVVHGGVQVDERRTGPHKQAARAALETALSTKNVEELRRSALKAWRR